MSLINCPECGRENVSDSAESCPNCGYGIKAHFEKIKPEEKDNPNIETPNINKSTLIKLAVVVVILFTLLCCYAFYQESRCDKHGCNESAVSGGKYCENHTCTTDGCFKYKDAWSNICDACRDNALKELEDDDTIQKLHDELVDKYGEDVFSDEVHMPNCSMSGCNNEGSGTYGGKWYCSEHLYEMKGYGDIISN